jgi:phage baseplate assembly protein gpV
MKEFRDALLKYGLEWFGIYYGAYQGFVFDNKDPEVKGRVRVRVPGIYAESPEIWALPRGMFGGKGSGFYAIPQIEDPIFVTFQNGNTDFPMWEYGWYGNGDGPKPKSEKVYVFQSPSGHRLEFDDDTKIVTITDASGFKIVLTSTGIFIGKDNNLNLGKFLDDLMTQIEAITTATLIGPQPPINLPAFVSLHAQLPNFLKKSL